ncbi:MAG: PEP-CTERM sorting domain-containing protein [Burkholderiaceae bacterium]|nr:PEP-CTERM sorting domain-containing protein [Burkholderiaceae bacterium]
MSKTREAMGGHARRLLALACLAAMAGSSQAATYSFSSGVWGGPDLGVGDVLNIVAGAVKQVNGGAAQLINAGQVNASDELYFYNGGAASNSGVYSFLSDIGLHSLAYGGSFANSGVLRKSGSAGDSVIDGIGFSNSGTIDAQAGRILLQSSGLSFAGGGQFTGAGGVVVTVNASWAGEQNVSGNLTLAGGTQTGNAARLNGVVNWTAGDLGGSWQVSNGQTLKLLGGGTKQLSNPGAMLTNIGTIAAADDLYFYNGAVLDNQGVYALQGDLGLHNAAYGGSFNNKATGVLLKTAGSGSSTIDGITFNNSGTIEAQAGTLLFQSGTLNFADGGSFAGAGQVLVTANASWAGGQTISTMLTLAAGTQMGSGVQLNGDVNWSGGNLAGSWQVNSGKVLNLQVGSQKTVHDAAALLLNLGTVSAADDLYFYNGAVLSNQGLYRFEGDVGLHNAAYGGRFGNEASGVLRKAGGSGTSAIEGITFHNSGTIEAQTGTLLFQSGTLSFGDGGTFAGAGQVRVAADASWVGTQHVATTLTLAGGTQSGSGVRLDGEVNWSGGNLAGDWQVNSGKTLNLQAGSAKVLANPSAVLTNRGVVAASDELYFYNGASLVNQGAYRLQGDVGLRDGGYGGIVTNSATLSKVSGSGDSVIAGLSFNNSGTIEAQTGTILFQSGSVSFGDGSTFSGGGQVVVATGATWTGIQNVTGKLALTGGTQVGAGPSGAMLNGTADWRGGNLNGGWQVRSGSTLNLQVGSAKTLVDPGTVLSNQGLIVASDELRFYNGAKVVNLGVYRMDRDVGLLDGGYGGHFDNRGLLVKTAGTGTSSVGGIDFTNQGTVSVLSGAIALPTDFTNAGMLAGTGQFSLAGTLSNNGRLAPGATDGGAPATLTISGDVALGATGSLDIDLNSLSSHDLLAVKGNVAPEGTLALSCYANCQYSSGDMILVLDATGSLANSTFAGLTMSGFATGAFNIVYDRAQGDVWLQAAQDVTAAVPEPASYGLMLGGLALLAGLVRRRCG